MSRKVKTVSFSLVSEYDSQLLEYAERDARGSFSKYIKRLIDDDMRGGKRIAAPVHSVQYVEVPEADDDEEAMSGFL